MTACQLLSCDMLTTAHLPWQAMQIQAYAAACKTFKTHMFLVPIVLDWLMVMQKIRSSANLDTLLSNVVT